ncbi:peptide/nickel transport system substrate-binding protein [Rhizobium sp. BK529]|uniref:ABC transporter substrate-binding protein n=1 Tax=unclassified Rhizobium TaxID=2613769 RepID=UPI001043F1E1|nr:MULTISPECIES: ABC transporter substrate-binding protein [unclassified Rhizobium]MBB3593567.1 peptide/nickel transport system substrate-binding protein [Rhizobium sp. BK529]TCS03355.1 peptide/nickel transport system substrate-binding protein [Rhizobium sp. BK418]
MAITRRKLIENSAAAAVGASIAASLGAAAFAQTTDTLKIAFAARGLRTIDPAKSIQGVDNWAIIHIYDKLVDLPLWKFPATMDELVPRLATSWTSTPDSKSWTLKLRQGVKFHKGYGEMTSADVKFTFDRIRDAVRVGGVRPKFTNISEVIADDPYTITFKLAQPDPLFLLGVLSDYDASVMSKKAVEEKGEEPIGRDPIGTGPYVLETVYPDPSQGVMLVANKEHWDVQPATPKLQCLYIADTTARTLALLSGDVHLIEGVRAPGWAASMSQRDPNLIFDVVSPGSFFTMQVNVTKKPFDDVRVRQALFYAIDRDEITTAIAPISKRTYGLNPPSYPGGFSAESIPADVAYKYDPEKAKSLLAEAGFPNGFSFKNDTSQREDFSAIMLMIQAQLRKVGINMDLNIKDHTAFHADQNIGTNTLSQQSSALPPVPTQVIVTYLSKGAEVRSDGNGGANMSHYGVAIPGIDDLLSKALAEPDLSKRLEIVKEIEIKALKDAVILPVSNNGFMIVRSEKVDLGYDVVSGYVNWPLTKAKIKA